MPPAFPTAEPGPPGAGEPARVGSLLLRGARLVPVDSSGVPQPSASPGASDPVDARITDGVVTEVGAGLERASGEELVEANGRWLAPGLWDAHVHLGQWAASFDRLDLSSAGTAAGALSLVRQRLRSHPRERPLVGFGAHHALWPDATTLGALDDVARCSAVVLVTADVHAGWVSSAARRMFGAGVPAREDDGFLRETDWFEVLTRLTDLPGPDPEGAYRRALGGAAARGIVGVVELEWARNPWEWADRVASTGGMDVVRIRAGVYPDALEDAVAAGWRTGAPVPGGAGLVTMGPVKVISDGSLSTATAHCLEPYADPLDPAHPRGVQNVGTAELTALAERATAHGVAVAIHAIGDAAVGIALDAVETTGAHGSLEHAQLLTEDLVARLARLGVTASVQPAHLLDDRDVTEMRWPGRGRRSFPLRDLLDAGARVTFGSDAPVAPLDPWLAMASAVHRSGDDRPPWHPEQHVTTAEALAASTDGRGTVRAGSPGDVVLLDGDPLAPGAGTVGGSVAADTAAAAARLREMRVALTVVGGRVTHRDL